MNALHEYEAWLDELDKKLYLKASAVAVEFGSGLVIPLAECRSMDGIVSWAVSLATVIRKHISHLPEKYLLERFVRLACEANRLNLDRALAVSLIEKAVGERHTVWLQK
jgi:hypothetical protein